MLQKSRDLTPYVRNRLIRLRFYKLIDFCKHSKSCDKCCWLWKGNTNTKGYGQFHVCMLSKNPYRRLKIGAHRFMWTIVNGHTSKFVLHTCDNPLCVNYNHLFAGNQKDNIQDMLQKGRGIFKGLKGEHNHKSKINSNTIQHMKMLREYGLLYKDIGLIVGVTESTTRKAIIGLTWKHLL